MWGINGTKKINPVKEHDAFEGSGAAFIYLRGTCLRNRIVWGYTAFIHSVEHSDFPACDGWWNVATRKLTYLVF
jgi:hypothetical protein